ARCHRSVRSLTERFLKLSYSAASRRYLSFMSASSPSRRTTASSDGSISAPDSEPAGCSGGGGLRLLWFVVHGPALHEQSVCRPRCAVLAGLVGVRARKERSDKKIAARVGPVERAGRSRYSRPARKATTSPNAVSRCGSCNTS